MLCVMQRTELLIVGGWCDDMCTYYYRLWCDEAGMNSSIRTTILVTIVGMNHVLIV